MITRKEYQKRILNCDYVGTMSAEYNEINLHEVKGVETATSSEIERAFLLHELKGYIDVSDRIYSRKDLVERILSEYAPKSMVWAKEKMYAYQIFGVHRNGKIFSRYYNKDLFYYDVLHVDNINKMLHRLRKKQGFSACRAFRLRYVQWLHRHVLSLLSVQPRSPRRRKT